MVRITALALVLLGFFATDARGSSGGWAWPVRGEVITPYANDNARPYAGGMHRGIDIAAPVGKAVAAAHAGEVTFAGPLGTSGVTVAVRTGDGYATSYLHLASESVAPGEHVAAGDRIGTVGTTGKRSKPEPHLHFGVRLADREHAYVDPLSLLPLLAEAEKGRGPAPIRAVVPVAPEPARAPAARHPVARPVTIPLERPAVDWGRVAGLGGLVLVFLALFGRRLVTYIDSSPWPSTSPRRSTTSTRSRTSATPTRRSPPTFSPGTSASVARTSSS